MKVWNGAKATGWLVEKTSGFLDARLSRRSFVSKATLAGRAIAASGCAVITQPGSPFTALGTGFMVFARTATGEVAASEYTGSSWTAWENLGGTTDPVRGAATA